MVDIRSPGMRWCFIEFPSPLWGRRMNKFRIMNITQTAIRDKMLLLFAFFPMRRKIIMTTNYHFLFPIKPLIACFECINPTTGMSPGIARKSERWPSFVASHTSSTVIKLINYETMHCKQEKKELFVSWKWLIHRVRCVTVHRLSRPFSSIRNLHLHMSLSLISFVFFLLVLSCHGMAWHCVCMCDVYVCGWCAKSNLLQPFNLPVLRLFVFTLCFAPTPLAPQTAQHSYESQSHVGSVCVGDCALCGHRACMLRFKYCRYSQTEERNINMQYGRLREDNPKFLAQVADVLMPVPDYIVHFNWSAFFVYLICLFGSVQCALWQLMPRSVWISLADILWRARRAAQRPDLRRHTQK